jgi:hypothetical protein
MVEKKWKACHIFYILFTVSLILACGPSAQEIKSDRDFLLQYQKSNPENVQKALDLAFDNKIKLGMSLQEVERVLGTPNSTIQHFLVGNMGELIQAGWPGGILIFHNRKLINTLVMGQDGNLYLLK